MVPTPSSGSVKTIARFPWRSSIVALALLGLSIIIWPRSYSRLTVPLAGPGEIAPLAMSGGSPHLRALMRTISASESNDESPYTLFYGGTHFQDFSKHPDRCIEIVAGPNRGNCTTAAGRYQFINTTWYEKAKAYHPKPTKMLMMWKHYSFEPKYQDQVVYAWLADNWVWDMDIEAALEAGQVQRVFKRLSGTWTSLGYGIEDNVVTPKLAKIYQRLLAEELASANNTTTPNLPQS